MTDLEMTKLCAQAMGYELDELGNAIINADFVLYDPLHDDAQSMALVKKLGMDCVVIGGEKQWWSVSVRINHPTFAVIQSEHIDLNRAICECVAKMQKAKATA